MNLRSALCLLVYGLLPAGAFLWSSRFAETYWPKPHGSGLTYLPQFLVVGWALFVLHRSYRHHVGANPALTVKAASVFLVVVIVRCWLFQPLGAWVGAALFDDLLAAHRAGNRVARAFELLAKAQYHQPLGRCGAAGMGLLLFDGVAVLLYWGSQPTKAERVNRNEKLLRGQRLIPFRRVEADAGTKLSPLDGGAWFGGVRLPTTEPLHRIYLGSTGSGKTTTLRLAMAPLLRKIVPKSSDGAPWFDNRALVFDPKSDFLPTISSMGVSCPIVSVNPFDDPSASLPERAIFRGVAWDMAKDITTDVRAQAFARILFPPNEHAGDSGFFEVAAKEVLAEVVKGLIALAPGRWTLGDVVRILQNRTALVEVLQQTHSGRVALSNYFAKESLCQDVLATVANKLAAYPIIAAAWERSPHKVTLTEWVQGSFILVIGNSGTATEFVRTINRVLFTTLAEMLLDQADSMLRRSYLILDELKEMGKLEGALDRLANMGRSRGCELFLVALSLEGLAESFGSERAAREVIGQCSEFALLRMDSETTAEFASKMCGEFEVEETRVSTTRGRETSTTTSAHVAKYRNILPSDWLNFPKAGFENGLWGAYRSSVIAGAWKAHLSGDFLRENLSPADPSVQARVPVDQTTLSLRPWSEEDRKRLGLTGAGDDNGVVAAPPTTANMKPKLKSSQFKRNKQGEKNLKQKGGAA